MIRQAGSMLNCMISSVYPAWSHGAPERERERRNSNSSTLWSEWVPDELSMASSRSGPHLFPA